ncbi:MAG: TlpA disulfide reductase family protein [Lapillicoccus sp.]
MTPSPSLRGRARQRRRAAAAPALLLTALVCVLGVAACSSDPNSVAQQAKAGDNKGFVAGNGAVEQLAASKRGAPVTLTGKTVTGSDWSMSTDGKAKVVVVNVWGQWCGPCVEEMPHLQQVWSTYEKQKAPVAFVGIEINEPSATGLSFLKANGVTYPSINNQDSGAQPMLALQGKAAATPTTLVLDRQGRIAARVLGATTVGTLTAIVDDVLAEQA